MMQPRCAICDADNDLNTLCDYHHWLTVIRREVDSGRISDWNANCGRGFLLHRQAMTSDAIAYGRLRQLAKRAYPELHRETVLWAELAAVLSGVNVEFDDGSTNGMDSYGDGLARYHLIDWQRINNDSGDSGKGQAA